jgi:hypothetical protein
MTGCRLPVLQTPVPPAIAINIPVAGSGELPPPHTNKGTSKNAGFKSCYYNDLKLAETSKKSPKMSFQRFP